MIWALDSPLVLHRSSGLNGGMVRVWPGAMALARMAEMLLRASSLLFEAVSVTPSKLRYTMRRPWALGLTSPGFWQLPSGHGARRRSVRIGAGGPSGSSRGALPGSIRSARAREGRAANERRARA